MIVKNDLCKVRKSLENHIGDKVKLTSKRGRKKAVIRHGIIENTYPSIFIVRLDGSSIDSEGERRVSYSYTDVLTRSIELMVCRTGGLAH